jgi:hypothetical protein
MGVDLEPWELRGGDHKLLCTCKLLLIHWY